MCGGECYFEVQIRPFWAPRACVQGKCDDMDLETQRLNNKNLRFGIEKTDQPIKGRRSVSEQAKSLIRSHIESNKQSYTQSYAVEDLNREIENLSRSNRNERPSNLKGDDRANYHIMKESKKTDPLPKVSDKFPMTPTVFKRTVKCSFKHGTTLSVDVKDILPPSKEKKLLDTPVKLPSNRKIEFSRSETEKFIEEKSSFQRTVAMENDSKLNITATNTSCVSSYEQWDLNTSPVGSCQPLESLIDQNKNCHASADETTARLVKESLYESSPLVSSEHPPETHLVPSYSNFPLSNYSTQPSDCEQIPFFRTPPPVEKVSLSSYRHGSWTDDAPLNTPGKDRRSRTCVRDSPLAYHRSRSWNRSHYTSGQEDQNCVTIQSLSRGSSWRESPDRINRSFSNEKISDNYMYDTNLANAEKLPSKYPSRWDTKPNHISEGLRGSFENLPQGIPAAMTKAPSLDNISSSSERNRSSEASFLYHLTPETTNEQSFSQRYCGNFIQPQHSSIYLPKQEADNPLEPNLNGHQLVGDSQLLRFSRQILGKYPRSSGSMRFLGLCVSGQTIEELLHKIKEKFYPLGEKVVLLIGTNDFLQNNPLGEMINSYEELISHLLGLYSRRLLLLTVPPIPRLAGFPSHWEKLNKFNSFISGYAAGLSKDADIRVADITPLFLSESGLCREECFEIMYSDSRRTDMVHLNNRGLSAIRDYLFANNMLN